jgi:hypothetical protein
VRVCDFVQCCFARRRLCVLEITLVFLGEVFTRSNADDGLERAREQALHV